MVAADPVMGDTLLCILIADLVPETRTHAWRKNMELQQPSDNSGKKADNNKNPHQAQQGSPSQSGLGGSQETDFE